MEKKYAEKTNVLKKLLDVEKNKKEKCTPTMMIAAACIPLFTIVVLYFLQPSFINNKEGDRYVKSTKKLFVWTAGITVLSWIAMYLFTYCAGYDPTSMICTK